MTCSEDVKDNLSSATVCYEWSFVAHYKANISDPILQ